MRARRSASILLGFCCLMLSCETVLAAPPWQKLAVFQRLESDPDKEYLLTEDNGPWTILAVTFLGDDARENAKELVLELRKTYKLPAYVHEVKFDYSGNVEGRGVDRFGEPKRMKYQRYGEKLECAVLVGDFPTVDDPAAQKTLQRIKYARPKCLEATAGEPTSRPLSSIRMIQQALLADGNSKKLRGPMGHAFICTNPLLPHEYYVPAGIDKLTLEMNSHGKYNLLQCPGKYTVQVAKFNGHVVVDQNEIREIERGADFSSRLADAADKAHRLTEALRKKGVEAYEFHDRYASLVTVGSFDSVGTPRADGKIEINPEIHKIMLKYGSPTPNGMSAASGVIEARTLDGIPFDAQPMPVEVPRFNVSNNFEYQTSSLRDR